MYSNEFHRLGMAWLALCAALALHVADEALTGFLSIYNPTVEALRERLGWFPMPTFTFTVWLTGLITVVVLLVSVSPFVFRGARWVRPLAYLFAVVMLLNGIGHTIGTIFGHTVPSIRFARPMPGSAFTLHRWCWQPPSGCWCSSDVRLT